MSYKNMPDPAKIRKIMQAGRSGKSDSGAPQFPGNGKMSMEEVRKYIMNQPRETGFQRTLATGNTVISDLKLPGDASLLLGINFNVAIIPAVDDRFSFSVNNNKIIDNGIVILNSTQAGGGGLAYTMHPYIPLWQPLSGQDDLELEYVTAVIGAPVTQFVLWYI